MNPPWQIGQVAAMAGLLAFVFRITGRWREPIERTR